MRITAGGSCGPRRGRIDFDAADDATKREVLAGVLWNLTVKDGNIASYQYKRPFAVLQKDPSGAFLNTWWAM
jgi:hypothetical protein